jgi:glycosyltransferase involved in cell wall biosynthesis
MKIVQVHNWYRVDAGENFFVEGLINLLKAKGEQVAVFEKNSKELTPGIGSKISAFAAGIYSPAAARTMARLITEDRPDVVHVHNLYPLLSPSILVACGRAGLATVLSYHNYRLSCPVGHHLYKDRVCEQCSNGREYWCILNNCRENLLESTAYALRNMAARKFWLFRNNVTLFIAPSQYVKSRLVNCCSNENQVVVLPNMVSLPTSFPDHSLGEYVGYVGRISPEKGIGTLLQAAALNPSLPVYIAGDYSSMPGLLMEAPENVRFLGPLERSELEAFYRNARFLVIPSLCYETFGLVAAEAMGHGIPVISSRLGGLPEIVEDEVTGFLFEPGNAEDLASKIKLLWENSDLRRQMGQAGLEKALQEYGAEVYYQRLMTIYQRAIEIKRTHPQEN